MKTAFPGVLETADAKGKLIAYSYGRGYKGVVATLILSKTELKIGIPFGATLTDPTGLLKGGGKVHRHVTIASLLDLAHADLSELLKANLNAWRRRSDGT
ncbi:MAG: hypothetical protein M3O09_17760 [Acidobacteriota bacterium]|nr:hypothetical protein [Acidobacteriota bacterium]